MVIARPPRPEAGGHPAPRAAAPAAEGGLPGLVAGPITRHQLGLYAGASGDYNPLHIDIDYARQAGMPDVFAHGMLSAAYLARVLTRWAEPAALRRLSVRFEAITHIGDEVHCQARVSGRRIEHDEARLTLALAARSQTGETRLTGTAVVAAAGLTHP
nr:MaoC/PaaZ C-terminal domain-containing protein [Comamonas sp.]